MVERDTSWIDDAACATHPLRFEHAWDYNIAKFRAEAISVCDSCPVRMECYLDAKTDPGSEGIRGGEMFKVRARRDDGEVQIREMQEL